MRTKNSCHVKDFLFVFVHSFPRVVFIFSKENENVRVLTIWAAELWLFVAARISRRGAKIPNAAEMEKTVEQTELPLFLAFPQILVHELDVPLRESYGYDGTDACL